MTSTRDGGLRPLFRKKLPEIHWTALESGLTAPGIPDANGCFGGVEFWIEFKKMSGWRVPLRPAQIGWLTERAFAGGRTFVAIRRKSQRTAKTRYDELWLVPGGYATDLAAGKMRDDDWGGRLGCLVFENFGQADWGQIFTALTGYPSWRVS